MHRLPTARPIYLPLGPLEVLSRWPVDRPLICLYSGDSHDRWARWSILATPSGWWRCDGSSARDGGAMLHDLDGLLMVNMPDAAHAAATPNAAGTTAGSIAPPFIGGWIGYLSYDLGRAIEPTAQHSGGAIADRNWPLIELGRCDEALAYDRQLGRWWAIGDDGSAGDRGPIPAPSPDVETVESDDPLHLGKWSSSVTPDGHLGNVGRTLEYIRAGDIYQTNISHRLTARFTGSTRRLAARALEASAARYGAYLEVPDGRCICSMSPELFLDVEPDARSSLGVGQGFTHPGLHRVTTCPIKGTRPARVPVAELVESAKDAAELHMIVDLMRNDLGRVCEFGTVRVPAARIIETHRTVHHGVGEVTGLLRPDVTVGDLIAATFPGGSITGAPKIRAMQIIDELEPVRRGPYCGAIGFFGDDGSARLNIAIRTMLLTGRREPGRFDRLTGRLDYAVGGGIVADSDPLAEYRETLDKAAVLRLALAEREPAGQG